MFESMSTFDFLYNTPKWLMIVPILSSVIYLVGYLSSIISSNVSGGGGGGITGNFVTDTFITSSLIGFFSNFKMDNIYDMRQRVTEFINTRDYQYNIKLKGHETILSNGNPVSHYKYEFIALLHYIENLDYKEANIKGLRVVNQQHKFKFDISDKIIEEIAPKLVLNVNQTTDFYMTPDIICSISQHGIKSEKESWTKEIVEYRLTLKSDVSLDILKNFLNKCIKEYEKYQNNYTDVNKLFLEYRESKRDIVTYDEFLFTSNKTFNNIFLDKKEDIKNMIDFFINNEKFYKDKGFPYTLGFLFSGDCGVGKSSIIKAIANYTNRHIIYLKLNKIEHKSTLMNILFSEKKMDKNINYRNSIYVIEDIDCDCDIVLKRTASTPDITVRKLKSKEELTSEKIADGILNNINNKLSDSFKKVNSKQRIVDSSDDETENSYDTGGIGNMMLGNNNTKPDVNKLTLSDLLNLIDGIVETPGRIMIVTTNYPEKLDKALIRPGRIDMKVKFGYCSKSMLYDIFQFFYDGYKLTDEQLNMVNYIHLTSAMVIQTCKLYHTNPEECLKQFIQ